MAKVKVLVEFYDKYTGKLHKPDEMFEADDKRISEIMEVSKHLIEVQKEKEESVEEPVEESVEVQEEKPAKKSRKKAGEE